MPHRPLDAGSAAQLLAEGEALRRLARSLLGGDGDDVVQEGYTAALANPAAARERGPWLAGTVRRLASMWRRTDRRRRTRELAVARDEIDDGSDPATIAAQAELAEHVAAAVRALDEPFRAAIVLRYWRGLLPEQIARELGVPRNTVRSRLQRGLERLRAQLDAEHGERSRWLGVLVPFAREKELVRASAAGGGLITLGIAMKTKLMASAALLAAAAFAVPFLLDAPPPLQHGDPVAKTPETAVAVSAAADAAPTQRAAAVPAPVPEATAAAATPAAPEPLATAPWLARFRVVDKDERAIDGATVEIHAVRLDRASEVEGPLLCELRTDPEGRASATIDRPSVFAKAGKGAARTGNVNVASTSPNETKLVLELPVQLRGRVVRADGGPAASAVVTAVVNGGSSLQLGQALEPAAVIADADGRFVFDVTQHAAYAVRAAQDGAYTFAVTAKVRTREPPEVVLTFPGGITLRGVVVDAEGNPVGGALVRGWREHHFGDRNQDPDDYERCCDMALGDGSFAIDVQRHARYQLVASAANHANSAAVWVEPTAERPHVEVQLALQRFATIGGTARHGDGTAFAGVRVVASLIDPNPSVLVVPSREDLFAIGEPATTGEDGRFSLRVHPGTHWRVAVFPRPGDRQFRLTIDDVAPGRDDADFTIREQDLDGCVVRGAVVMAADGLPATNFELSLRAFADGKADDSVITPRLDGNRFEVTLPRGQTWVLDVLARIGPSFDIAFPALRIGPFTSAGDTLRVDARVPAWAELPVRVLRADGSPARGLSASTWSGQLFGNVMQGPRRLDADGRTVLRCAPGPQELRVANETTALHRQEVLVTAGSNPEVLVRLPGPVIGR